MAKKPGTSRTASSFDTTAGEFSLDRADWQSIALIVAFALAARLLFVLSLPPLLHLDSDSYFEIAERLWRGEGFGDLSRRTPLYPIFLWLAARFETVGLLPVVILQHLLGVATVVLLYLVARRLLPLRMRPVATISGLLLAVIPYPILTEHSILSESIFLFLLVASMYSLLAWWQEDRARYAVACGALLALAALTRPIAAGIFPLWVALLFLLRRKEGGRRALGFLLCAGLAWAALLAPLLIRNYFVMGSFALERSLGRNLISVADRWISYGMVSDPGAYPEIRAIYGTYLQQKRGSDAVVVYAAMPELRRATGWTDPEIDRALAAIAWEGIRGRPRDFLIARLRRLPLLFRDPAPSYWYTLQAETYLPFLARTGRINPELVSRSLAGSGLANARFDRAERAYRALSLDFTSGWWFLLPLLGLAGFLFIEKREPAWILAATLAYLWLATIFLQPPNARFRLPGLPWETLFAVAGMWFALRWTILVYRKCSALLARLRRQPTASPSPWGRELSDRTVVWLAAATLLLILGGRAWAVRDSQPILRVSDLATEESAEPGASASQLLQELAVTGRRIMVLYWEGALSERAETVSAEAAVPGGGSYAARVFYSCETAVCAGARIELTALDGEGRALAQTSAPLSQERIDNDLFWDQIELRIAAPNAARRLRVELELQPGLGNLVIPQLAVRPAS